MSNRPSRRRFLAGGVSLASLGLFFPFRGARAEPLPGEEWLQGLRGKHRIILDVSVARDAALRRTANYLDAYREAYGLGDADLNVLFGAHGNAVLLLADDALWERYGIGRRLEIVDPAQGAPASRNPYRTFHENLGWPSDYSIATLQRRGVRFLACGRSLARVAGDLAKSSGENRQTVLEKLHAGLLPGVTVVPAMIVAVDRAQETGLSYASITG